MIRRKKKPADQKTGWLVTFSDIMALLLAFFVLLFSMSSMDLSFITRVNVFTRGASFISQSAPGRLSERIRLITAALKDPADILNRQKRIKDLLFPLDALPPEISAGDLDKNLSILAHPEGVVIVLTDSLLFSPGSALTDQAGKKLLDQLAPVMHAVNADINISGHTDMSRDDTTGDSGAGADELSFLRAAAVLEHFLRAEVPPSRFSVSGYGPDKPLFPNTSEEGRKKNRRVEILVKTTPRVGSYL